MVTMVSYAIVYRQGPEHYIAQAQAAGVAGAIVPDLPVEESEALAKLCRAADFNLIQLVTPTTSRERALRIAATSTGFLYYVSVTGITGERTRLPADLIENVAWLRENRAAHRDRLRDQPAGARSGPGSGGRRIDCRLGDRAADRRGSREIAEAVIQDVGEYVSTFWRRLSRLPRLEAICPVARAYSKTDIRPGPSSQISQIIQSHLRSRVSARGPASV